MATLQQQIVEKFLAELRARTSPSKRSTSSASSSPRGKKLKADDFVSVFALPAGGDLQ